MNEPLGGVAKHDSNGNPAMNKFERIEWHLLHGDSWYPLDERGYRPVDRSGKLAHWSSRTFPKSTPVGWRGNVICWKVLDNMPKVFWLDNNVGFSDFVQGHFESFKASNPGLSDAEIMPKLAEAWQRRARQRHPPS